MVRVRRPRLDSLFARLLLAQAALVVVLGLLIGALFYVERNITIATLYADRWAPQLAAAAGLAPQPMPPMQVLRREAPPASGRHMSMSAPRFAALRRALAERGVPIDDVMLRLEQSQPMVWLHVAPPGGAPVWLGVGGNMVVPEWSRRTLSALLLGGLAVAGASWAFTRRLTRPLERLRTRMQSHTPGQHGGPAGLPAAATSPEIAAIDAAYTDLLARLHRYERERAMLLAGVSHDLRSPLGRIRMAAELLPDNADLAPRRNAIVRNVAQADRLIESFLDFVRSGTLACDETVDLAATARAVVAGFERSPQELSVEAPARLPWPHANRLLVERLMTNLVDNALKHGRPPVRLVVEADSHAAWVEVVDAGDGIAPALVEHLQEAFTRGDHSRTTAGSGLGLAIVRQVTQRLGGELSFQRTPGAQRVRVTLARERLPG